MTEETKEEKKLVKVKYQCQHLTCRLTPCYVQTISVEKDRYIRLKSVGNEGCFRSPQGVCKLGTAQQFKIIEENGNAKIAIDTVRQENVEEEISKVREVLERQEIQITNTRKKLSSLEDQLERLQAGVE